MCITTSTNVCCTKLFTKKKADGLGNRQNFVDGRMKQSRLPKSRFLLKIRRDKIQKGICVCVCVHAFKLHVYASLCWYYSLTPCWEDWFTVNSLDLLTTFRMCLFRVFPLTVTNLIADFRDFPSLSMQELGYTSISSRPLASTPYQLINHHSPTIRLYTAWHTSRVAKWTTDKPKYL